MGFFKNWYQINKGEWWLAVNYWIMDAGNKILHKRMQEIKFMCTQSRISR